MALWYIYIFFMNMLAYVYVLVWALTRIRNDRWEVDTLLFLRNAAADNLTSRESDLLRTHNCIGGRGRGLQIGFTNNQSK